MAETERFAEIPLFPLNTVLFPRMALPLRIFEPRYRQMLEYCLEHDKQFGVLLIKSGREVGGAAEPYTVGTTAIIQEVESLQDDTYSVMARGERRFLLLERRKLRPYQVGLVEYLTHNGQQVPSNLLEEARAAAERVLVKAMMLNGEWARQPGLPDDPEALSFALASRLSLDTATQQRILEMNSVEARLRTILEYVAETEAQLAQQLMQRAWLQSFRAN